MPERAAKVKSCAHQEKTAACTSAVEAEQSVSLHRRHKGKYTSEAVFHNCLDCRLLADERSQVLEAVGPCRRVVPTVEGTGLCAVRGPCWF